MDLNAVPEVNEFSDDIANAAKADKHSRDGAVARMAVYVEWLLIPKEMRVPQYKKDLATALGISTNTLIKYDHDPWLRKEYLRKSRVSFTVSRAADVIETLAQRATDPMDPQGVAAAKTLLTFMQAQDEAEDGNDVDLGSMTTEELVALAQRVDEAERLANK